MAEASERGERMFAIILGINGWFSTPVGSFGSLLLLMAKLPSALSFHLSRKQEFEANDIAVELTHPKEVSAALEKITALNEELYADRWQFQLRNATWVDRLWDTHPPTPSWVERQRSLVTFLSGSGGKGE